MQDVEALQNAGLMRNDRKVYLALIESGPSAVGDLVKKTGLHRSYIYDILEKLVELGLVGFIVKNNKKYFEAANPNKILELFETEEQKIKQNKKEIGKVLPELKKRFGIAAIKQEAKLFVGKEGVKAVLEEIIAARKDFVAFGAEGKFKDIFKMYFGKWQSRREKQKIKYKIIYNEKLKQTRPLAIQKLVEVKFVPVKYDFPATTLVFGEKTAIIIWDTAPIALVLESKQAAKSFTNYFELLWKIAKR